MDWTAFFKHFALYSVMTSTAFGYWLYRRTRHTNSKKISYSAVTNKANYYIFGVGITISTAMMALNVYGYMMKATAMPPSLFWIFGIAFVLLLVLGWVPATEGLLHEIHHWSAWIMSYLLLTLVGLLFVDSYETVQKGSSMVNGWLHVVGIFFVLALAIVGTYTNKPGLSKKQSLHSQQLYFFVFQLAILTRIYLG
ncbi:hypothetical protein KC959_03590 [Candidatus Saccharibacteria bacterium]|nr:hypothetical protein [Candidatus Saccharibacteria bacterium]